MNFLAPSSRGPEEEQEGQEQEEEQTRSSLNRARRGNQAEPGLVRRLSRERSFVSRVVCLCQTSVCVC